MPEESNIASRSHEAKTRITYIYALVAFASLLAFGLLQILVEGKPTLGQIEIGASLTFLLAAVGLRATRNVNLACNLIILSILVSVMVMLITGGTANTGILWAYIFPISAFFLTNKRVGMWWMVAMFSTIGVFMVIAQYPWINIPYDLITLRQLLVSLFVTTIGIYVYQQSREDITQEAQKSDAASKENRIKADFIVDHIGEGVVAVDAEGRIVLVNRAAADMLGWDVRKLLHQIFTEAIPMHETNGRNVDVADRPLTHTLQRGEGTYMDATYVRKDGSTFVAALTTKPIIVDGKVRGAIVTFRDTTAEQTIDHAKSEFVTLASHQLRTPISAISWVSELLIHGDAGKLTKEQEDYVHQIYHSNKRMAALVDAMLTASSLELGNLPVRPEPVDLTAIAREVLEQRFALLPHDKILHVKEQYDPDLVTPSFDPNIVRMILQNLLANAFKYTPTDGTITITIKDIDNEIVIEVSDTGVGIPLHQQAQIFTKLFRAENVKHQDTDGTGLGLYIVKKVTEYVGGRISFVSEEHKGSVFTVYLPKDGMEPQEVTTQKMSKTATVEERNV